MVDIPRAYEHDLYSLHPSLFERFLYYRFELSGLGIFVECRLSTHGTCTLLPILYAHSFDLPYVSSFDIHSYCKSKKFIETKVPAINCRVLTFA
jgi:hypothetical protein